LAKEILKLSSDYDYKKDKLRAAAKEGSGVRDEELYSICLILKTKKE